MWKKVLLSVSLIAVLVVGIEIFYRSENKKNSSRNVINEEKEISSKYVTDECIDEWEDYALTVQEEIKEVNESLNDENRHYILKEKDNYVNVYYINEDKEEILYRVTEIGTGYLAKDDVEKLREGIEVIGLQNLNQLLEDFE